MIKKTRTLAVALSMVAGAALAHTGVRNQAVKARMHAMGIIGENTKVLGSMYKGQTAFDAAAARAAAGAIAQQAARIPTLFAAPEDDPKSEALPAIWTSFDDFTEKAQKLSAAAQPGDLDKHACRSAGRDGPVGRRLPGLPHHVSQIRKPRPEQLQNGDLSHRVA